MILAGDIGATNIRLAVFDSTLSLIDQHLYKSQEYESFEDAVRKFLESTGHRVKSACFGVPI